MRLSFALNGEQPPRGMEYYLSPSLSLQIRLKNLIGCQRLIILDRSRRSRARKRRRQASTLTTIWETLPIELKYGSMHLAHAVGIRNSTYEFLSQHVKVVWIWLIEQYETLHFRSATAYLQSSFSSTITVSCSSVSLRFVVFEDFQGNT